MGSMIPIFLLGYYGFGNWGDELSLLATLRVLEDIGRECGFPFVYHILSGESKIPLPIPERCHIVPRSSVWRVLKASWESAFFVVGGGSLLQDVTSLRSLLYYAAFLTLAKGVGKKRVFFGCGLGPFQRRVSEWITCFLLRGSGIFLARDEETFSFLKQYNLCPAFLTADPVFLLWDGEEAFPSSRVAVFLRRQALERVEVLLEAFRQLQREGVDLECVAFHRDADWDVASFFGEKLGVPVRYFQSVQEVIAYFQALGGVISMRLHPLVLATCFGIPWCAFDLDPKIRSFGAYWGGRNLLSLAEVTPETVFSFLRNRDELQSETLRLREVLVERAKEGKRELTRFFLDVLGGQ